MSLSTSSVATAATAATATMSSPQTASLPSSTFFSPSPSSSTSPASGAHAINNPSPLCSSSHPHRHLHRHNAPPPPVPPPPLLATSNLPPSITPPCTNNPSCSNNPPDTQALSLRMPPDVAAHAHLATAVSTAAPSWAIAHDAAHPRGDHLEVTGSRNYQDIFRLPNLGGVISNWLFTRPSMEAISEDSFANAAVESMTLFRIEGIDSKTRNVMITPTVSSHYLFIPCQTINGFTVGLAYLDNLYERDSASIHDNRVPPLRLGRFVIDDATGEIFCSAWMDNMMVVAWTQSILKCERVREFLLFDAPKDGTPPKSLLLRNSFFERRDCALCGKGYSITSLPPPCSAVDNRRLSQDPTLPSPRPLTNIAALYRRFRGAYFGVVLKTRYGSNRQPQSQQLVPVFVELKHGLHTVKVGFKNNLRKNIDFVLGGASNDGYFGMNPRCSTRSLLMLRAGNPVGSFPDLNKNNNIKSGGGTTSHCSSSNTGIHHNNGGSGTNSILSVSQSQHDMLSDDGESTMVQQRQQQYSRASSPGGWQGGGKKVVDVNAPKRKRAEDPLERDSVIHKRKVRNRISAQRSNKQRKMALEQKKADLERLKVRRPLLEQRLAELRKENEALRLQVYGPCSNTNNNNNGGGMFASEGGQGTSGVDGQEQIGTFQQGQQGQEHGHGEEFHTLDVTQQQEYHHEQDYMNVDGVAQIHHQLVQQQQEVQQELVAPPVLQQQHNENGGGDEGGWLEDDSKMETGLNISDPCLFVR